jgi:hypothetical protein
MFMRVNSKCAHQVRPPLAPLQPRSSVGEHTPAFGGWSSLRGDSIRGYLEELPSYFKLKRKARISRSVFDSFDRNM